MAWKIVVNSTHCHKVSGKKIRLCCHPINMQSKEQIYCCEEKCPINLERTMMKEIEGTKCRVCQKGQMINGICDYCGN